MLHKYFLFNLNVLEREEPMAHNVQTTVKNDRYLIWLPFVTSINAKRRVFEDLRLSNNNMRYYIPLYNFYLALISIQITISFVNVSKKLVIEI